MSNPSELEAELDGIREDLASSIDQLLYRSHPKVVVKRQWAKVKALFVDPENGEVNTKNIGIASVGAVVVIGVIALVRSLRR